jgi:gamma-glutamyl-gamma-aminobutyrate hydrolase PuuD
MKIFAVSMNFKQSIPGNDLIEQNYLTYLNEFNIQPLLIPNVIENTPGYLKHFDIAGVILTGGTDIDESLTNVELVQRKEKCQGRDAVEWHLLEYTIRNKLSVLGICRGMQFINVFFGGGLTYNIQRELPGCIEHVAKDHEVLIIHPEFKNCCGCQYLEVNSYHNHGVTHDMVAPVLREFVRSTKDRIVEGLFHPELPVMGVQWHPERRNPLNKHEFQLLKAFFEAGKFWQGG